MDLLNLIGVKYQDKMKLYDPEYFYPLNSVTKECVVTSKTICVHHFLKTWTPKTILQQFKYNIENNFNFSFVKRGDGELACMNGEPGGNCDGHPYSPELAYKLREAYKYLRDRATIVEFDDQVNYNVLLHRTDSDLKEVSDFYKAIGNSSRRKFLIAPERLLGMQSILKCDMIEVIEVNAFSEYDKIFDSIPIVENAIYMFCAGMPAKPLIADLLTHAEVFGYNITCLDCGSAFDPSVSQTRTEQITKEQFWELYEEKPTWLEQYEEQAMKDFISKGDEVVMAGSPTEPMVEPMVEPVNNFNLPQENHPERLWAASQLKEGSVVWDLGCGSNKTVPWATGFDIRPVVTDWCGDIQNIQRPGFVDVIISKHSLEHLLNPVKAIRNWTESLKPGGKMLIILPDHEFIDTMDEVYSRGQHLHAYTRESFADFISLFPGLYISKQETVLDNWSFGTVIYKLPKVTVVLPTLGRPEGLENCLMSIKAQDYPSHLIEVIVIDGEEKTVPQKVEEGVSKSTGEYICFAANDTELYPDTISTAIKESLSLGKGLVSFNSGPLLMDKGNINEHFVISKDLVKRIGGYVFDLSFFHVGCDNYLWQQCDDLGEAYHSENAKMIHNHFSKGAEMDIIYEKGWSKNEQDRRTLVEKLTKLNEPLIKIMEAKVAAKDSNIDIESYKLYLERMITSQAACKNMSYASSKSEIKKEG